MSNDVLELQALVDRVGRRLTTARSLRGLARGAAALAVVSLAWLAADGWLRPGDWRILALASLALLFALAAVCWALWPFHWKPTARQVARMVEERCPELEDRVATAVEFGQALDAGAGAAGPPATALLEAMLADAAARARDTDQERIVSRATVRRATVLAIASVGLVLALLLVGRDSLFRALTVATLYVFPERVEIVVEPGDTRVGAGDPLRIVAYVRGLREARSAPTLHMSTADGWRSAAMLSSGERFEFGVGAVMAPFSYRVSAGRAETRDYRVSVLRAPRVTRIDLRYEYPRFTGLRPRVEEDSGDIYAPAGTRVEVNIQTNKPIESGAVVLSDGTRLTLTRRAADRLDAELLVLEDGAYRVALADAEGMTSSGETEYFIRTMDDRPPDVRILRPGSDRQVTQLEEVAIEARADDDYGVERLEVVYAVRGWREVALPLKRGGSSPLALTGSTTLYLEDLNVRPGDFVTYYARARDVGRGKRSTEARSDIFFLEVKPYDETFFASQSQAQAGSSGNRSLDDLAAAQKEIVIATWKLDRRASGGRSEPDIKAVARAQGELKTRAEQMAGQARARDLRLRRGARPQVSEGAQARPAGDPMASAAEAMGRALGELDALKTAAALPHEMEALNQLLKAQAEVRRYQVSRQQALGGGGGSGANQDLSSLFDRELMRQQQTNYETPASSEPSQQEDDSEALARVRELSRRQDQLNQEERDLARQRAQLSADELKRRLERLTREQSELRRQAEELSRQLARQQASSEGSPMRDVSEEMRSAASDLRRQDPAGASARGSRAVEKLRELERQLRSAQPDEQRRALGELQLEARQLAEGQRQVASDAGRAGNARQSADELRRLAGAQERLADRASALETSVKRVARQGAGSDRQALADAQREIERQQVDDRMRASASALRKAAETTSGAQAERQAHEQATAGQELAQALDRIAEKLGAASGIRDASARRLSEQIGKAREARDRLRDVQRGLEELAPGDREAGSPQGQTDRSGSAERMGAALERAPGGGGDRTSGEWARLQSEYDRQLRQAQELVRQLGREYPEVGRQRLTPGGRGVTLSAPGTEAFKQDFARWGVLAADVALTLERVEDALAAMLRERQNQDRLHAGHDDRAPEAYRKLVEKYYELLAAKPKP